ncbi:MAG: hypothetical protein JW993_03825 [Sedimentisphaerales bacterium]|nr:hypothetical protein [Sedimentisphaerales bacterium]
MTKRRNGQRRHIATLAFYGPNDQHASKVVAAIAKQDSDDIIDLKRWVSGRNDVRQDAKIQAEIIAFFKQYDVKQVVYTDRIIGCPHEEGPDYPKGQDCPFCPFWAGRDRWTGKMKE